MAITNIKCRGCKSPCTLGLRGRWFRHTEQDGREMMDVRKDVKHPEVIAVRCAVCHMYFHVREMIEV